MIRLRSLAALLAASLSVAPLLAPSPAAAQAPVRELGHLRPVLDATGYRGTVLVYDLRRDRYHAVNAAGADARHIPASTFKILNALVSLELGLVADEHTVIPWNGVRHERTELNRDLDLQSAFRVSAVPHFQELARRVGEARMREWVERVGYGNRDIAGGQDRFWLDGALRISPREQIGLLVRLYRGQLPFSAAAMESVKRIMVAEQTPRYTLRAKTGWARLPSGHVGWWVGWVEQGEEVFFFATNLRAERPGDDFGPARLAVTRAVLAELGAGVGG